MRPILVALLLTAPALAGCVENALSDGPAARWREEAAARGSVGVAATFDLTGSPILVRGEGGRADVEAPFDLAPAGAFPSDRRFAYLVDAEVESLGQGLLVIEGAPSVTEGSVAGLAVASLDVDARVALTLAPALGERVEQFAFPPGWEDAGRAALPADLARGTFKDLVLDGFAHAALVAPDGTGTNLTGPVRVTRASGLAWAPGSFVEATAAKASFARASVGGNVTGGKLDAQGFDAVSAPSLVVARDVALRAGSERVATTSSARLTQAESDDGLLLDAGVEVAPADAKVTVKQGGTAWLRVEYRETTGRGDAVLGQVETTGDGRSLVTLPLARPPLIIQDLMDEAARLGGVPGAFLALSVALASPAIILADVFNAVVCTFATCPEQHPYPTWMDAGDVGAFYVRVEGKTAPGSYQATVHIAGQNYGAVTVPIEITVTG